MVSMQPVETDTRPFARLASPMAAALVLLGLVVAPGCGGSGRAEGPGINVGLAGMIGDEADPAADPDESAAEAVIEGGGPQTDLESLIAQQAADLARALGTPPDEEQAGASQDEEAAGGADVSLEQILAESGGDQPGAAESFSAAPTDEPEPPAPLEIDALYTQLGEALGQELGSTSEPFRTAVALIALAAAQGLDPLGPIGVETVAGGRLSPEERESAEVVAMLLGSLLSPGAGAGEERAGLLREFSERLSQGLGLTLPNAVLCTRVRGFGKYEAFGANSFLAGRRTRALVYVEVEGFEHGRVDTSRLGGLPVEEEWSVELAQTLELYHAGESAMLAWMRPEEVVVETSRNKQRDFYLLTEIELPQTLTVGAYQLKVIVRDRVGERLAEALIPIKIVADPALAWTPE